MLIKNPNAGDLIQGSGDIRKIRWGVPDGGKRGGRRVVYYWAVSQSIILMLSLHAKNKKGDLTKQDVKVLRHVVESEYP
jgi:hypothetical protein